MGCNFSYRGHSYTRESLINKFNNENIEDNVDDYLKEDFITLVNKSKLSPAQKKEALEIGSNMQNPLLLFKGKDGKRKDDGSVLNVHEGTQGMFMSESYKTSRSYGREDKGVQAFIIDANDNFDVVNRVGFKPNNVADEVASFNNSNKDYIYFNTADGVGVETQIVIKNPDILYPLGNVYERLEQEFVTSNLYNEIRNIPFLEDKHIEMLYTNIYGDNVDDWRHYDNNSPYVDNVTGEPKLYFKSTSGNVFTSLDKVLGDSYGKYYAGFIDNDGNFKSVAELPIPRKDTVQGFVLDLIKNGWLKPSEREKGVFEPVNSFAKEMLLAESFLERPFLFKSHKDGVRIVLDNFVEENIDLSTISDSDIRKLESKYGKTAVANMVVNEAVLGKGVVEEKDVVYTESELNDIIHDFMNKVGISTTSIEEYTKRFNSKNGINPTAEAFIDINNKIIAFSNGEITTELLTEEIAHFIVEAWDQNDVSRVLEQIPNTQEYLQYSEMYRAIYSEQSSDPDVVEELVRKEVLGKMLAETFRKDFTVENKTEIEKSIFDKISEWFRNFINFIRGKVTKDNTDDIKFFTEQIKNLMFNKRLHENLKTHSPISKASVMYSVDNKLYDLLSKMDNSNEYLRNLSNNGDYTENQAYQTYNAVKGIINNSTILSDGIIKHIDNGNPITPVEQAEIERLLNNRDVVEKFRSKVQEMMESAFSKNRNVNELRQFMEPFMNKLDDSLSMYEKSISQLDKKVKDKYKKDVENIVEYVQNKLGILGISPEIIKNIVNETFSDANMLVKYFGHTGKTSNPLLSLLNQVVKRLRNKTVSEFTKLYNDKLSKLLPHRELLKKFSNGSFFVTDIDMEKKYEDELSFEYEMRKLAGDGVVANISREYFIDNYISLGPVSKNSEGYYKYVYNYRKNYSKQKFATKRLSDHFDAFIKGIEEIEDLDKLQNGTSVIFNYKINMSNRRNINSESEVAFHLQDQREKSDIYDGTGKLKEGFEKITYSEAKKRLKSKAISESDVVSLNPKYPPFKKDSELKDTDEVIVRDKVVTDNNYESDLTFKLLKFNEVMMSNPVNRDNVIHNFEQAYNDILRDNKDKSKQELNAILKEWFKKNVIFSLSQDYWDTNDTQIIDFESLYNFYGPSSPLYTAVKNIEQEMKDIRRKKNNILRKYRNPVNTAEIDTSSLSDLDKFNIEKYEAQYKSKLSELSQKFDDADIDMYNAVSSSSPTYNNSFYRDYSAVTGTDWFLDDLDVRVNNLHKHGFVDADAYIKYKNFARGLNGRTVDDVRNERYYRNIKDYHLMTEADKKKALSEEYLKTLVPSWYKRFDPNNEYTEFVNDFNRGSVDMQSFVQDFIDNYRNGDDSIYHNGERIEDMVMMPANRFSYVKQESVSDLYDKYLNSNDDLQKWDLLLRMGNLDGVKGYGNVDTSWIKNNKENLSVYIQMMDLHLMSLDRYNALTSKNIFMRGQFRKTETERIESFLKNNDKVGQIKDAFNETFLHREDDFMESYKDKIIPKYGLMKLDPSELTDDIFATLGYMSHQSILYSNKMESFEMGQMLLNGIANQEFKGGKKGIDSNYYQMAKEMIDFAFYGKQTQLKYEVNILGIKFDIGKLLMWFRQFSMKQALGFSPIVAATNFMSGMTQNQMLKWIGKDIYTDADDRALMELGPLIAQSTGDIGKVDPNSKLNRVLYSFGVYDMNERIADSQYGRGIRALKDGPFAFMAITNHPLQSRVTLSKLMELRLIDGRFMNWQQFRRYYKVKNPNVTNSELKIEFNKYQDKSMYDYLDQNGDFDMKKLEADNYKGNIEAEKITAMGMVQDVSERVTMEIMSHNEGFGSRNPIASFFLSLKKWLILANTAMFSGKRFDYETGDFKQGMFMGFGDLFKVYRAAGGDFSKMREEYGNLDEYQKESIRAISVNTAVLTMLYFAAMMLKAAADDDDEEAKLNIDERNYLLQTGSYLMTRNLNETFSGNYGIVNSWFESLKNPIASLSSVTKITKLADPTDIGEEVTKGKYKGMDAYLKKVHEATFLRNMYNVKDADTVFETAKSYRHFSTDDALYNILSW